MKIIDTTIDGIENKLSSAWTTRRVEYLYKFDRRINYIKK